MSDVTVKYGSTGFEKVRSELSQLEKGTSGAKQWFSPMSKGASEAAHEVGALFSKMEQGAKTTIGGLMTLGTTVVGITAGIAGLAAIVGGAGVAAFTSWTASLLKTTEGFRKLEISLYGSLKSWEAVNKVSSFAKEYAAEYPAMYGDIMRAMQSLAFIPSLKPAIQKGDVQQMKEFMHVVQGLMVMRPEQGIAGSIWALREALAGNWRSLQMRFDVPIASIAKSAGMTMAEMKSDPQTAMKAMKGWINEFVGADTMSLMAKNLGIQLGNLKDKYEIWIDTLGKSGIYDKVVGYLLKLNDAFDKFMKSEKVQKWTEEINKFLESVAETMASIFTKGIDWEKISSVEDLKKAFGQLGKNLIEVLKGVWDKIKDPLAEGFKSVFAFAAEQAVKAFAQIVVPGIAAAMKAALGGAGAGAPETPGSAVGGSLLRMGAGSAVGLLASKSPYGLLAGPGLEAMRGYKEMLGLGLEGSASFMNKIDIAINGVKEATDTTPSLAVQMELEKAKTLLDQIRSSLAAGQKLMGIETPEDAKTATKRKEFMAWMKKPLWEPGSKREAEIMGAEWKEAEPWRPTAGGQLEYYGQWAKMGGMMAGRGEGAPSEFDQYFAREKERMGMRGKWEMGEISTDDWRKYQEQADKAETKRGRMATFGTEKEAMLTDILGKATEKKEYGIQSKVYGEMFNTAYQKGDFGKAQEFMNKSLESMLKQMEKEDKRAEGDSKNLEQINENTAKLQAVADALTGLKGGLSGGGEKSWGDQMREEVRTGVSNE